MLDKDFNIKIEDFFGTLLSGNKTDDINNSFRNKILSIS